MSIALRMPDSDISFSGLNGTHVVRRPSGLLFWYLILRVGTVRAKIFGPTWFSASSWSGWGQLFRMHPCSKPDFVLLMEEILL